MFTGVITELGKVKSIARKGGFSRLDIICERTGEGLDIGDSVAVNGVCLSVVDKKNCLCFDVVGNTFDKTNLKRLKPGDTVNLENALKLGDVLSGHMVSGHVDAERVVKNNRKTPKGWVLDIGVLPEDGKHVVLRGSIAVDGVSLTVGELFPGILRIFLIPHTLENSTLNLKRAGDYVNLEFDMMAKYAEKRSGGPITKNMLREKGFI